MNSPGMILEKPKDNVRMPRRLLRALVISGSCVLLVGCFFGLGIRYGKWNNPAVIAVARLVHFPAAVVDGHFVRYADVADDVRIVASSPGNKTSADDIWRNVVERSVNAAVVAELADRYAVRASDADIDRALAEFKKPYADDAKFTDSLKTQYGWTVEELKQRIIIPVVTENKLRDALEHNSTVQEIGFSEFLKRERDKMHIIYFVHL